MATLNELDLKCIAALTQSGAEDLVVRLPGKIALAKLLTDPEKMKMRRGAKIALKRRGVYNAIVQNRETEKQPQALIGSSRVVSTEVTGIRLGNERPAAEVEHLRGDSQEASASRDRS